MFWGFSPEQITTIIAGAVTIIMALLGAVFTILSRLKAIRKELSANSEISTQALTSAVNAEERAQQIQIATVDRGRLDLLERWYRAYETFEECEGCRERIRAALIKTARRASDSELTQKIAKQYYPKLSTEGEGSSKES